jgi:hypothetical protein
MPVLSRELNDWVSLAFVILGLGGPKPFADYAFVETTHSFPKSQTESLKHSHPRS